MDKSLSRILFLSSLGLTFLGAILGALFYISVGGNIRPSTNLTIIASLLLIGGLLGGIFWLASWVGALVKMAELKRWRWFVFLIFGSVIAMLFYIFFGPRTPPLSYGYVSHKGYHWVPWYTPFGDQGHWEKDK